MSTNQHADSGAEPDGITKALEKYKKGLMQALGGKNEGARPRKRGGEGTGAVRPMQQEQQALVPQLQATPTEQNALAPANRNAGGGGGGGGPNDGLPNGGPPNGGLPNGGFLHWLFNLLDAHPHIPLRLWLWFQLVMGIIRETLYWIVCSIAGLHLVSTFVDALKEAYSIEHAHAKAAISRDIANCTYHYNVNNCTVDIPALVGTCLEWLGCMQQDRRVSGFDVGGRMLVDMLNIIVEGLSWKTLIALLVSIWLFATWFFANRRPAEAIQPGQAPAAAGATGPVLGGGGGGWGFLGQE